MEVRKIVENLIKDIQDIQNNILRLKNSSDIPLIEVDIVLEKLRDIYESVSRLKTHAEPSIEPAETETGKMRETEDSASPGTEEGEPEVMSPTDEKETSAEVQDTAVLELETGNAVKSKVEHEENSDQDLDGNNIMKTAAKTPEIVADRFKDSQQFRNESLAKTIKGGDLSSKLQSKPIKDIGSAIGINDRFLYIKELFDGSAKKFDDTIRILNNAPNFNEAYNYLSENFSWDMDNPAVQNLLELTRRKHIIDTDE
ncbi:MAG: hypothetical protein JSV24_05070 [Bacteroidales bacterium]|nr:MAG: hypothetical protein JSV24_05070 [Bacteroidales bacterium]